MQSAVTPELSLSEEQEGAINFVLERLEFAWKAKTFPYVVAISGPAGTGKSTIMKELVSRMIDQQIPVQVCGMTNKAAHILRRKGVEDAITFHQAVLSPILRPPFDKLDSFLEQHELEDKDRVDYPDALIKQFGKAELISALETAGLQGIYAAFRELGVKDIFKYIEGWRPAGKKVGVLVVDEASMLGEQELNNAREVYSRVVLVGDENQLPPVKGAPVFWTVPNRIRLEQIHRQAEGSQPLDLATKLRLRQEIQVGQKVSISSALCAKGMPVIVWRNKTRVELTLEIRKKLGFENLPPQPGEWLICRNTSDKPAKSRGLINNTLWQVVGSRGYGLDLVNEDGEHQSCTVHMEETDLGNGIPFRFAYAVSGHSSQGSQYETVQVHHGEAMAFWRFNKEDARKWLYTAVTRAEKNVLFVTSEVV